MILVIVAAALLCGLVAGWSHHTGRAAGWRLGYRQGWSDCTECEALARSNRLQLAGTSRGLLLLGRACVQGVDLVVIKEMRQRLERAR